MIENTKKSVEEIEDDPAPPLINYTPIGGLHFKNDLVDEELKARDNPVYDEDQRIQDEKVPELPVVTPAEGDANETKAAVDQENIYTRGELQRKLRDQGMLNKNDKFKNLFLYKHAAKSMIGAEREVEKKKMVADLLYTFHKKNKQPAE
jgi:hypothetical protein